VTNVSQEQLSEEDVYFIAGNVNDLHKAGVLTDKDHGEIDDLITSYRLVLAELQRYRSALEEIANMIVIEANDGRDMRLIATYALEGGPSK
jgi:hypothetical protein